jgi:hypothetical protein
MAANTEMETKMEETRVLYLPKALIQESHIEVSIPE